MFHRFLLTLLSALLLTACASNAPMAVQSKRDAATDGPQIQTQEPTAQKNSR